MTNFITAVSNRRTNYTLSKNVTIPQETITKTIEDVIREVPSAFNMQSGKAVIAFGETHDAIWKITMDTLRKSSRQPISPRRKPRSTPSPKPMARSSTSTTRPSSTTWPPSSRSTPRISPSGSAGQRHDAVRRLDRPDRPRTRRQPPALQPPHRRRSQKTHRRSQKMAAHRQMPFGHPTEPPKPIVKVPIEERVKVLQ